MAQNLRKHFSIQITHHWMGITGHFTLFHVASALCCKGNSLEPSFVEPFSRDPFQKQFCRGEDFMCQFLTVNLWVTREPFQYQSVERKGDWDHHHRRLGFLKISEISISFQWRLIIKLCLLLWPNVGSTLETLKSPWVIAFGSTSLC